MKKISLAFIVVLVWISPCLPNVTSLPWECDFDSCSDWTFGQALNCCGLNPGGPWKCNNTIGEQINSTTGYGGTGKAQIHWVGAGDDNGAGGLMIEFDPSAYSRELYIRFYVKFEPGYDCGSCIYNKDLYIDLQVWGMTVVAGWYFSDGYQIGGGPHGISKSGCGWKTYFSDNQWHWIEVHLRYGSKDGIKELWIDGRKVVSLHNISFGQASYTFRKIRIGSNQCCPVHSGCKYRAYDNIKISTTGPIGPLGGGTPPTVNPPGGCMRIK